MGESAKEVSLTAGPGPSTLQPASLYPFEATDLLAGCRILLTHQVTLPTRPYGPVMESCREAAVDAVVFGHNHSAFQELRGHILFFNSGAAGKRRFNTVSSIAY